MQCALCGSKTILSYKNHPGYMEGNSFDIYDCSICHSAFASPLSFNSNGIYEHIYKQADIIPGYYRYYRYAQDILHQRDPLNYLITNESIYWGAAHQLELHEKKNSPILEIGCGFGYFTHALHAAGYSILGTDLSAKAIDHARQKFGAFYKHTPNGFNDLANPFAAIVALETIEHLPDPIRFFKECWTALPRNGKLIVTTPNRDHYSKNMYWFTENPPVHLWWFSRKSLEFIASHVGFSITFESFSECPLSNSWNHPNNAVQAKPYSKPFLDTMGNYIKDHAASNIESPISSINNSNFLWLPRKMPRRIKIWLKKLFIGPVPPPFLCATLIKR